MIDAELQQQLYDKHPANVVRLILNKDEPGDDEHNNRYTRAARLMRTWQREGVLFTEADPAIYVYHQVFNEGGTTYTRRGFMCRVRLERFGEGNIYPHEETHGAAKADRLKLWSACKANLSQIFGLYPDEENEAQNMLEAAIAGVAPLEATDHLGVVHRIWPVTDVATITAVIARDGRPARVHRRRPPPLRNGLQFRDKLRPSWPRGETLSPEHPANYVLMMLVSMSDPGMLVLATHRLFRGLPPMTSDAAARASSATASTPSRPATAPIAPARCGKRSKSKATRRRSASTRPPTTSGRSPASPTPAASGWPKSPPITRPTGKAWA